MAIFKKRSDRTTGENPGEGGQRRYRVDTFAAVSLKGNPLGSPFERVVRIYLPPGYFEEPRRLFPVVYLLHGYGADGGSPMIDSRRALRKRHPLWLRILFHRIFSSLLTFEELDRLILGGLLPPFILAQPDASLHRPNIHGVRQLDGRVSIKGSLYIDSPSSGRYAAYVFEDVPDYVEGHYRTTGDRYGRSLMGGSMGGYGALLGGILHPELFQAIAALSPGIGFLDLLDVRLLVPLNRRLLGRSKAAEMGCSELGDILDTCDLVLSASRPLLPSLRRDETGRAVQMDGSARDNWARFDLGAQLDSHSEAFRGVRLLFNCARADEFALAGPCRRFHGQLRKRGIEHGFEIYSDRKAERISPHVLGIAWHLLPALRFCLGA
jgi:pimeloyl-ACP methyl ester carboxylesterase